jgi:hypothetical protein
MVVVERQINALAVNSRSVSFYKANIGTRPIEVLCLWKLVKIDFALRVKWISLENASLLQDTADIPKLRGEVARLRSESQELDQLKTAIMNDPTESVAKSWLDRVSKLKQSLAQMPEQTIPGLRFLTEQDWLNAVKNSKQLTSEADFNQALSSLRSSAKNEFARLLPKALRSYAQVNNGQLPADFSKIKSYFGFPADDGLLQRYEFTEPGVVGQKATPLDDQDDTYYKISVDGISTITGSVAENTLKQALQEFAAANHGQKPSDPSQLLPYVKTPAEQAVLQRLLQNPMASDLRPAQLSGTDILLI